MAIIVKNGIKVGVQAPTPQVQPEPVVLTKRNNIIKKSEPKPENEPTRQVLNRRFVIEPKKINGVASQDTTLVVNGKQKSIGRKSHYLLDMLTLDDE
jgi:hypothetical protein